MQDNPFKNPILEDEPGNCLNKYFPYKIEQCLINYESKYENKFGFIGGDSAPSPIDPMQY
jgi:hypothetical protein